MNMMNNWSNTQKALAAAGVVAVLLIIFNWNSVWAWIKSLGNGSNERTIVDNTPSSGRVAQRGSPVSTENSARTALLNKNWSKLPRTRKTRDQVLASIPKASKTVSRPITSPVTNELYKIECWEEVSGPNTTQQCCFAYEVNASGVYAGGWVTNTYCVG